MRFKNYKLETKKKYSSSLITGFPAGEPGVQRWLKFVKYLPDFGWESLRFIPENPSYPIVDETLQKDVPKNLQNDKNQNLGTLSIG